MRKATITITEEMLRARFEEIATELEHDGTVTYPDDEAREEFIADCVDSALDGIELYDWNPITIYNNCEERLLDLAQVYGYLNI